MKPRHYVALIIAALVVIASFFMPNAVAHITDMRRLDNLTRVDSEFIRLEAAPYLTISERLALAGNSNTNTMPLTTGLTMDSVEASAVARREITRFFSGGGFTLNYMTSTISDGIASFIIDRDQPSLYMIIWEFEMVDDLGNSVIAIIDDATGIIMRLIYRQGNGGRNLIDVPENTSTDEMLFIAARALAYMMNRYYELYVILADYNFATTLAFYRADVTEGSNVIPLYGVVRASSFTMNERV